MNVIKVSLSRATIGFFMFIIMSLKNTVNSSSASGSNSNSSQVNGTEILEEAIYTLNQYNKNISYILNHTITPPPVMIAKTGIPFTDTCTDNPLLLLLPYSLRTDVNSTLLQTPEQQTNSDYCKKLGNVADNCCTSITYTTLTDYLSNTYMPAKIGVFDNNIYIFTRIINEHLRNMVTYYQFDESQFLIFFKQYQSFIDNLRARVEVIVRNSIMFFWDSMCSFICNPKVKELCKVYNVTYSYNNSIYFDYEFACEIDDSASQIVKIIQQETEAFMTQMKTVNSTIDNYYHSIYNNTNEVINLNDVTMVFFQTNNGTMSLFNKSLDDGHYVSKKTGQKLLCDSNHTSIINSYVGNYSFLVNSTCETILDKICLPFGCLDDSFLQFNEIYRDQSLLLSNFSKVSVTYNENSQSAIIVDPDIEDLINSTIVFADAYYIGRGIGTKTICLLLVIYIISEFYFS